MAKGSVYEGKTQDEAVRKGLEDLGLQRAEATITTIEEGKSGFLGFGARPFRVSISRRPGGAIREPEEARTPERRSGRAGREERSGGRSGGRGGREERSAGGRGEKSEKSEKVEKTEKVERSDRSGRGERGGRGGREERKGGERKPEPARAEVVSEERAPRPERTERPERAARPERGERRGRGGREGREAAETREPREERRAVPAAPASPAPIQSANGPVAESDEDGAAGERRRRRRGRRGGRGRRRDGRPEGSTSAQPSPDVESASVNGAAQDHTPAPERQAQSAPAQVVASQPVPPTPAYEAAPVAAAVFHPTTPAVLPIPAASAPASHTARPTNHPEEPDMGSEELTATAKRVTEDLLKAMGFEATITAKAEDDRVDVTVQVTSGEDLLNGNKGETRLALQHLLNRFVNSGEGARYHLQLEINDFWQQREKELEDMALRMADEALAQNAEKITDFLNSQERRIVHVTLKPDSRVKTYALGNGMVKRVAIAPADFPERTEEDAG